MFNILQIFMGPTWHWADINALTVFCQNIPKSVLINTSYWYSYPLYKLQEAWGQWWNKQFILYISPHTHKNHRMLDRSSVRTKQMWHVFIRWSSNPKQFCSQFVHLGYLSHGLFNVEVPHEKKNNVNLLIDWWLLVIR